MVGDWRGCLLYNYEKITVKLNGGHCECDPAEDAGSIQIPHKNFGTFGRSGPPASGFHSMGAGWGLSTGLPQGYPQFYPQGARIK